MPKTTFIPRTKRRAWRGIATVTALLAASLAACGDSDGDATGSEDQPLIYAFWPNTTTPAWPTYYIPAVKAAIEKEFPGSKIVEQVADGDSSKQLSQVDAAVAAGADIAVFTAANPAQAAGSLRKLSDAEIPVVGFFHDPIGGDVESYVAVDFKSIGETWGEYLEKTAVPAAASKPLRVAAIYGDPTYAVYNDWVDGAKPYLDRLEGDGNIEIVCQSDVKDWAPQVAQDQMDQCLTKTDDNVDAVLVMNDSTADGVWAALKAQGLNGDVPIVGGHDGSLTALQRILVGDQTGTFIPDADAMGTNVAKLLRAAYEGDDPDSTGVINGTFDNQYVDGGVPTAFTSEILIDADTFDEVLDAGIFTKDEICDGIAADTEFCTK